MWIYGTHAVLLELMVCIENLSWKSQLSLLLCKNYSKAWLEMNMIYVLG